MIQFYILLALLLITMCVAFFQVVTIGQVQKIVCTAFYPLLIMLNIWGAVIYLERDIKIMDTIKAIRVIPPIPHVRLCPQMVQQRKRFHARKALVIRNQLNKWTQVKT